MQRVDRGPAAGFVTAFPRLKAFGQGTPATGLDFGGQPGQPQEGAGPADGAGTEPGGRGESRGAAGVPNDGPAVAPSAEVGRGSVGRGHREDRAE